MALLGEAILLVVVVVEPGGPADPEDPGEGTSQQGVRGSRRPGAGRGNTGDLVDQGEGTSSGIRAAAGHKRTQPTVEEVANMYHEDDDTHEDEDDIEKLNGPGKSSPSCLMLPGLMVNVSGARTIGRTPGRLTHMSSCIPWLFS